MIISFTLSSDGLCIKCLNMRQAKSQCKPWKEVAENYFQNTDLIEPLKSVAQNKQPII